MRWEPGGNRGRVRSTKADIGLAWDGDYDRCFFFDEHGQFIEGITSWGCSRVFLKREPGARIVTTRG